MLTYLCSFLWLTFAIVGGLTFIEVNCETCEEYPRHRPAILVTCGSFFSLLALMLLASILY